MPEIRVVTLNIWNRSGPWEERFGAIKTTLARLSPDLIGLQEVIVTEHGDLLTVHRCAPSEGETGPRLH